MLKKIKSQKGMALATIIGILAVITVLATSLYIFSRNDVFQADITLSQTQASYLARASVEAASKGFPKVAGAFQSDQSVLAEMYLRYEGDNPVIDTKQDGSIGKAEVKITMGKREITIDNVTTKVDVWCYESTARVDNYTASSKGYVPLIAYTSVKPKDTDTTDGIYLGWVKADGAFDTDKFKVDPDPTHAINSGALGGFFERIWDSFFKNSNLIPYLPKTQAFGALVINNQPTGTKPLVTPKFTNQNREFYLITAQSIFIEPKVMLNHEREFNTISMDAETIVFEDEVHIYAPALLSARKTIGNLILSNEAKMTRYVYFKAPVYAHRGNTPVKIFEGGTAYKLNETVDLLGYAYDTNMIYRGLFGNSGDAETYTGNELEKVDLPAPTVNSMSRIIWE